jgi:hypothetical protein
MLGFFQSIRIEVPLQEENSLTLYLLSEIESTKISSIDAGLKPFFSGLWPALLASGKQ